MQQNPTNKQNNNIKSSDRSRRGKQPQSRGVAGAAGGVCVGRLSRGRAAGGGRARHPRSRAARSVPERDVPAARGFLRTGAVSSAEPAAAALAPTRRLKAAMAAAGPTAPAPHVRLQPAVRSGAAGSAAGARGAATAPGMSPCLH